MISNINTDKCPKCGRETYTAQKAAHLGLYCPACGWLKWIAQPWQNFHMPIGKYRRKTLLEIKKIDPEYLAWCAENLAGSIARRAKEAIDDTQPT